jgi:hypothetical protein
MGGVWHYIYTWKDKSNAWTEYGGLFSSLEPPSHEIESIFN